uniref:PH domain-containing protein n=1 Tax=Panagrolaimus sp. ES5 TaxID=591445 RepID=A0AC34FKB5_9BILA
MPEECKSPKNIQSLPKIDQHQHQNQQKQSEKKGILRSLSFQFTPFYGTKKRRAGNTVHTYDTTPEEVQKKAVAAKEAAASNLGPIQGVQCQGLLLKKCNKKTRVKWNKRFFILKECFLLYYAPKYKKKFDKSKKIDMHPKGIVPLIGCSIVPGGDIGKGKKYCLLITHPQFDSAFIVSASDVKAQEKWLKALREATKISFKNTIVGESLIRELESKGMLLNEEKKGFEEKLQVEAEARKKEAEKNTALEKTKDELEKERQKLVKMTKKLKDDLNKVKSDLKLTIEGKKTLEQEKVSLMTKTQHLVSNLESLNMEKSKTEDQMSQIIREREKFLLENQNLSSTTCQLKNRLMEIESKTTCLATEKEKVENFDLKLTIEGKKTLEQEKVSLMTKTQHLVSNLESLNMEKSKTEDQMSQIIREREKFLLENQNLSSTTCQLKNRLMEIESKTTCLATEKEKVENLLRLNERKTQDLEHERQYYNCQTKELLSSLKEISQQKEMTEAELRDEMMARLGAERQLQAAEKALEHLENALRLTGAQMTELQEHIMPDVHKLREFFEKCAEEARLEADKGLIMKNAVYARRSFRRTKRGPRTSFRRHTSMKNMTKPSYYANTSECDESIEL